MTIQKSDTIDFLIFDETTGHVVLELLDEMDWTHENQHVFLLQNKLNAYLRFAESGEAFNRLAADRGVTLPSSTPIKINVRARFPASPMGQQFLAHTRGVLESAGFAFDWKIVTAATRH